MTRRGAARVIVAMLFALAGVGRVFARSRRGGRNFAFHPSAPTGEWLNDPNALLYRNGHYELYAQHSVAGPTGGDVGWARFTSKDLLSWKWKGLAIPPDAEGSAYSGSVVMTPNGLEAFFTRHNPRDMLQTQHKTVDPGWRTFSAPFGPAGRNCRDPYVFFCARTNDWRMIVAEPCDWTSWSDAQPSCLSIWASNDRQSWTSAGHIGPWGPPGVMWEVPILITFGEHDVLILSLVDRRDGRTRCEVRYWVGKFDGMNFVRHSGCRDGWLLDYGPDFYAAIVNLEAGWPLDGHVVVAWAGNWEDAPSRKFFGGSRGGPLTLPRKLALNEGRLTQKPIGNASFLKTRSGSFHAKLHLDGLGVEADRSGQKIYIRTPNWSRCEGLRWSEGASTYELYCDGELRELFIDPEGISVTWISEDFSFWSDQAAW